jgi:hypothetical protein
MAYGNRTGSGFMPHQPKAAKKSYSAPSFRKLDANPAKAALEAKAVPGDGGARVMLNSISSSKAEPKRKTAESTLQVLEKPVR